MWKLLISLSLAAGFVLCASLDAQAPASGQQVPTELSQYVRDARKAGIKDPQIEQNALNAGWPAETVAMALKGDGNPQAGGAAAKPAEDTKTTPPAAEQPAKPSEAVTDKVVEAGSPGASKPAEAAATTGAEGNTPPKAAEPVADAKKTIEVAADAKNAAAPGAENKKTVEVAGDPTKPVIDRGVPEDYVIGAGDELQISVWKEADASVGGVVVRPDGKISMPILKEVSVVGLTPTQAEKLITDQLVKFIAGADVAVIVKGTASKKIFLLGGVKKEGPIPYTYRMTVLQALSEAGGLTDYAKKKKIYVLRHDNGRDYTYPFDYDAALRGQKMDQNIPLLPGDTVVVPK